MILNNMKEDPIKGLTDMWNDWLKANSKALDPKVNDLDRGGSAERAESLIGLRYEFIDMIDEEVDETRRKIAKN